MVSFPSVTQYDKMFGEMTKNENQKGKNFCPFFSLCTIWDFFRGGELSMMTHELCVARAVTAHVLYDVGKQLFFTDLIALTNQNVKNIEATSVELVKNNIIGFNEIFPVEAKERYVIMILKNGKFFVVCYCDEKYYVRDCHESIQFGELTREAVVEHLTTTYQFTHEIDLDGYKVQEYSNIEFIRIREPFVTKLNFDLKGGVIDAIRGKKVPVVKDTKIKAFIVTPLDAYPAAVSNNSDYVDYEE